MSGSENIGKFLATHIPKEFLLQVESFFQAALEKAAAEGRRAASGHRSTVTGVLRHFDLNEALEQTFTELGIPHSALRGNSIMVGQLGPVTIARFHKGTGAWNNSRRSAGKVKLCDKNVVASLMIQPDFLRGGALQLSEVTCFLVTEHDGGSDEVGAIYLIVPNLEMDLRSPLFRESLPAFLQRYEVASEIVDTAFAKLKPGVVRKPDDAEGS